jgi:hypothetical protein
MGKTKNKVSPSHISKDAVASDKRKYTKYKKYIIQLTFVEFLRYILKLCS